MPGREIHPDMRHWNKQAKAHHQEARATLILSGHYLGFLPTHVIQNWGLDKDVRPLNMAIATPLPPSGGRNTLMK